MTLPNRSEQTSPLRQEEKKSETKNKELKSSHKNKRKFGKISQGKNVGLFDDSHKKSRTIGPDNYHSNWDLNSCNIL